MSKRFSVEAEFKAKDKVTAPITRMQNRFGKNMRRMGASVNKFNRKLNSIGRGLKKVGIVAGVIGVAAIGMFTNVARSGLEFEKAIAGVGAVSLQTRDAIAPLEEEARRLGRSTKFTATESAQAMEILARSGFKMNNVLKATEPILLAATASGDGMAETADNVVSVLKGMGLNLTGTIQGGRMVNDVGTEAARVADVLARASSLTNSTMASLGEGMSKVAFKAKDLQIPLEDIVASVALMQDIGIDPAISGTAIKTMISKMAKPSNEVAAAMRQMGLSFKNSQGDFKTLPKLLGEVSKAAHKLNGNYDKTAFLVDLVGMRGQIAAAGLADLYDTGRLSKLTGQLQEAEGTAKLMAELRMDNAAGDLVILASAIDSVKISMLQMTKGPLRDMIQQMTEWVNTYEDDIASGIGEWIAKLFDSRMEILATIQAWAKWAGVILALVMVFKVFAAVLALVNLIMVASPWGLVIAAVVVIIAVITALIIKAGGLEAIWKKVTDFFVDAFISAANKVKSFWDGLVNKVMKGVGKIMAVIEKVKQAYQLVNDGVNVVKGAFSGGGEDGADGSPGIASPQDRLAAALAEKRMTSEITLRDETGRAEVTGSPLPPGVNLQASGAF